MMEKLSGLVHQFWMDRNEMVHMGMEEDEENERLNQEIEVDHGQGMVNMARRHRYLFEASLDNLIASTRIKHQRWLGTVLVLRRAEKTRRNCVSRNSSGGGYGGSQGDPMSVG